MYFLSHGSLSTICKSYCEFHHLFKWEQGPSFPSLNSSFDIQIFVLGHLIRYSKETLDMLVLTGAFKFQAEYLGSLSVCYFAQV